MLERGKRHIVEIVSCYTTHYKGILHFVLEENGINNKMLENDLYDLRYKQAEGFLPDAEKYVDAILKSTIPGDNSFCGKCYQYGMAKELGILRRWAAFNFSAPRISIEIIRFSRKAHS